MKAKIVFQFSLELKRDQHFCFNLLRYLSRLKYTLRTDWGFTVIGWIVLNTKVCLRILKFSVWREVSRAEEKQTTKGVECWHDYIISNKTVCLQQVCSRGLESCLNLITFVISHVLHVENRKNESSEEKDKLHKLAGRCSTQMISCSRLFGGNIILS